MVNVFAFAGDGSVKVLNLDEMQRKQVEQRDWEFLQLSKHITQLRDEFNDPVSLKLLEATLETNAMLVREDYE